MIFIGLAKVSMPGQCKCCRVVDINIVNQIEGWRNAGVGNAYGSGYGLDVLYGWMEWVVG